MTTALTAPMPIVSATRLPMPQNEFTLVFDTPYGIESRDGNVIPVVCEEVFFFGDFVSLVNVQRRHTVESDIYREKELRESGGGGYCRDRTAAHYAITISQLTLKLKDMGRIVTMKNLDEYPTVSGWLNKSKETALKEANELQALKNQDIKIDNVKMYIKAVAQVSSFARCEAANRAWDATTKWFKRFNKRDEFLDKHREEHKNDPVDLTPLHTHMASHDFDYKELQALAKKEKELDAVIQEVEGIGKK